MGIFLEIFQQVKKASFYYKIVCQIYNHTDRSVLRCNVIFLEILTEVQLPRNSQEYIVYGKNLLPSPISFNWFCGTRTDEEMFIDRAGVVKFEIALRTFRPFQENTCSFQCLHNVDAYALIGHATFRIACNMM